MTDYDNSNQGAIWRNEKKETETHPDFTGSATIGGVEYWVKGWKRGPDANPKSPALKLKFARKDEQQDQKPAQAKAPAAAFADDDINF